MVFLLKSNHILHNYIIIIQINIEQGFCFCILTCSQCDYDVTSNNIYVQELDFKFSFATINTTVDRYVRKKIRLFKLLADVVFSLKFPYLFPAILIAYSVKKKTPFERKQHMK